MNETSIALAADETAVPIMGADGGPDTVTDVDAVLHAEPATLVAPAKHT